MAGPNDAEAKRRWIHEMLHVLHIPAPAKTGGAAPSGGSTDLMDPNADDDAQEKLKKAEAEVDAAGKDAAAKQIAEEEAEAALAKAKTDLDTSKAKLGKKMEEYYEAEAKALGGKGLPDSDLPAPMLPDCVPEKGKIDGPKEHMLCKTHGHVLNTEAKMIIAHDVKEYDARHPVPRPMESDCKPVKDKLPTAPDNIMLCGPHEHVLDVKAKQIVANSVDGYLKKHPPKAAASKPSPVMGTPTKAPAAPAPDFSGNTTFNGQWKDEVHSVNGLEHVFIELTVAHEGQLNSSVNWSWVAKPTKPLPAKVNVEIDLIDSSGKVFKQLGETDQPVEAGKHYVSRQMVIYLGDVLNADKPKISVKFRIVALPSKTPLVERSGVIEVKKSHR